MMRDFAVVFWSVFILTSLAVPDVVGDSIGRIAAHAHVTFQEEMQIINEGGE